jgi:hypothetical protein
MLGRRRRSVENTAMQYSGEGTMEGKNTHTHTRIEEWN